MSAVSAVTTLGAIDAQSLSCLLARYALTLVRLGPAEQIPGSYWGAPEAGLVRASVFARDDTPVHSVLHEAAHYVCMTPGRRLVLFRDAGGDTDEECAVCYLQVLWCDEIPAYSREQLCSDMDEWGYSFREGSVRRWLEGDGCYARDWLRRRGLIDAGDRVTWRLRTLP
jgi:hypothetical protein